MSPGYKHYGYLSDKSFFTQLERLYLHVGGIVRRQYIDPPPANQKPCQEISKAPWQSRNRSHGLCGREMSANEFTPTPPIIYQIAVQTLKNKQI